MKITRKQLRNIILRESNLILEATDNSKLAQDVADSIIPVEDDQALVGEMNARVKNEVENRLNSYPELAQELLQFLDSPTATMGVVAALGELSNILSKYTD